MTHPTYRPAITATGLCKSFGDKVVVDGIDLDVQEGTTFALPGCLPQGRVSTAIPDAGIVPMSATATEMRGASCSAG